MFHLFKWLSPNSRMWRCCPPSGSAIMAYILSFLCGDHIRTDDIHQLLTSLSKLFGKVCEWNFFIIHLLSKLLHTAL
jgi:hypothetical protein